MMRKSNGFVFMETIIVISILSITLLMLFASYSYILRKSREKNTFDTTEVIYKTYYVRDLLKNKKELNNRDPNPVLSYIYSNLVTENPNAECSFREFDSKKSYTCDLSATDYDRGMLTAKLVYDVDKFYYLNPHTITTSPYANQWLNTFDATTIDYILDIGDSIDKDILIVKYKKYYSDGTYEVFHGSMEVN